MIRDSGKKTERLAAEVRRQIGTETMARFLKNLPAFRTEANIPKRFMELLDRLDRVEGNGLGGGRK